MLLLGTSILVEPTWRETYPTPPDFIGSRPATVKLTRSILPEHKQLLKKVWALKAIKLANLVPVKPVEPPLLMAARLYQVQLNSAEGKRVLPVG